MAALPYACSTARLVSAGAGFRKPPGRTPLVSLAVTGPRGVRTLTARWGARGWALACSTSFPGVGRVGWPRREGNASLLSFGEGPPGGYAGGERGSSDPSQVISAMLPFVVAATAVAALANPSTFCWCVAAFRAFFLVLLSCFDWCF